MDIASGSALNLDTNNKWSYVPTYIKFTLFVIFPSLLVGALRIFVSHQNKYIKGPFLLFFLRGYLKQRQ